MNQLSSQDQYKDTDKNKCFNLNYELYSLVLTFIFHDSIKIFLTNFTEFYLNATFL